MSYVNTVTGLPTTFREVRLANPGVSFPSVATNELLAAWNVAPLVVQADPTFNPLTEKLVPGAPVFGTEWTITKVVVALSAEEAAAAVKTQNGKDDEATLKSDVQVLALLQARPTQINNYIDANVSNLAEAKDVLKILARAVAVLAKETL